MSFIKLLKTEVGLRNIILYIAASIDNFIADKNGGINWLSNSVDTIEGEDYGYTDFYSHIDTTLMGNGTYRQIKGFDVPFPYAEKTNYVFTRNKGLKDNQDVKYVSEDGVNFVNELKLMTGSDIWLVGGCEINTLLLNHDLIDEIILTRIPVLLGDGIPMFSESAREIIFKLQSVKEFENGVLQIIYKSAKQ